MVRSYITEDDFLISYKLYNIRIARIAMLRNLMLNIKTVKELYNNLQLLKYQCPPPITLLANYHPFCAKSTKYRSFIHKITGVESLTKLLNRG